jgi:hypothetical protein
MAEVPLVFGNTGPASLNASLSPVERSLSHTFMAAFTNFSRGGDAGWVPFSAPARVGLVINTTAVAMPLGDAAAVCVDIWDKAGYVH